VEKRKLIEVALPLETINRESAREKSIRHGHPSTLHLWWARRPLAAARAVLFAQLVDDPSAHPDEFPTEELQRKERERLHGIIERLVVWENIRDEKLLAEAHAEIMKSCHGNPPPIVDPFAGGGTIPLEAQRLGLEAHASDLNPVAVLINKALIEIPPKFRDQPPVFPGLANSEIRAWKGAEGLAADVRAYGKWMRDEAEKRIGHLYPKATLPDGSKAMVIAWIWARTATCPNPACGIEMPLVRTWWLGKKKGKEAYVVPRIVADPTHSSGQRVTFEIGHNKETAPSDDQDGTAGRSGATCVACETAVGLQYLRAEGKSGRLGEQLMVVVAEGARQRIYLPPTDEHVNSAMTPMPETIPPGEMPGRALGFRVQAYGMIRYADLFTNRQIVGLTTFSSLVMEARKQVLTDGGSPEYGDAVATYAALAASRGADRQSAICSWDSSTTKEQVRGVFARQAMPMTWDFAETNPFAKSSGTWTESTDWIARTLELLPANSISNVHQKDAPSQTFSNLLVSTDPPYYDNVPYADLSNFFYVWLRRALRSVYPELLSTLLVPKAEELVADPYRHGGREGARRFFEDGFRRVFVRARESALDNFPITVYYAFKQSETDAGGEASTGWETLLEGMIRSGWEITSTWPLRSELGNRMRSLGSNALASSVVLSLRPRPDSATATDRRGFIAALEVELPDALRRLQQGLIAPVDLPQAAIGPGMAVFSRYAAVIEPNGKKMTVRGALIRINVVLDQVLTEQEGDFDPTTRWSIAWYRQHGFEPGKYGEAELLANARGAVVQTMDRDGVLVSRAGKVALIRPADTPPGYDVQADAHISAWEVLMHLIRILNTEGVGAAGAFLAAAQARPDGAVEADLVKELAHLLFRVADKNAWSKDALAFNTLVTSWSDVLDAALSQPSPATQGELSFDAEDE